MLAKPLSTWIVSKQSEEYTYYFDPESAILAYQYCDYPGIMIISMQGKNLYTCSQCGTLPQIHITKAGKYFLQCPSSFISGGEDCEPGEKYDNMTPIPKDIPVFDTIKEAVDDWNKFQSYHKDRKILRQKIVDGEITEWKQVYDYLFKEQDSIFPGMNLNTSLQCETLCRLLNINISEHESELFNLLTDENWDKDEKAFDVTVEALCKMVLKKFRIQVKYPEEVKN